MPRGHGVRGPGSSVDTNREPNTPARRQGAALSFTLYPERYCNGYLLAIRDHAMGLHQSRYAFRKRGHADSKRGIRADGLSAQKNVCYYGGPGCLPSALATDQNAQW